MGAGTGAGTGPDAVMADPYDTAPAPRVEITTTATGAVVCSLTGDLDLDGLERVRPSLETVLRTGATLVVLDLEQLGFCDSSGLNLLLALRLEAEAAGTALRLGAPPRQLLRLLELTGAMGVLAVHPTVADALAAP